ncbi:MAG: flagellar hook-basal body complex protein [Gracilibacteraceae bacterium]|jgi:flagellar hook protein FlgE|nr:flagellar hook-basal body complex protein [Gracilibacteraceae bacterium]
MSRALYTSVSGLKAHQTKMDVIANNIANVNTYGYKTSRATFRDVFYQNISAGGGSNAATGGLGGMNPFQVGYGAAVASIDTSHANTGYATTNIGSDCYINGEGYFIVGSLQAGSTEDFGPVYYSRVGMFEFDEAGWLVDITGRLVAGVEVGATGSGPNNSFEHTELFPIRIDYATLDGDPAMPLNNIKIGSDGVVSAVGADGVTYAFDTSGGLVAISGTGAATDGFIAIALAQVPNPAGLEMVGNSYYTTSANAGDPLNYQTGTYNLGSIRTGGLEMSATDISQEFADMIMTQRGFQANARIINVVDGMLEEVVNLKR